MAKTLKARLRHEPEPIKGSRFIATIGPVSTEAEAREFVQGVSREMPDATHHCWALRLARPSVERAVDDGEPGGSAGRPILAALTGRDVVDACVVVTRYYGGTKLGVGGLVRAYGGAAAAALDTAELVERVETETWRLRCSYEDGPPVERALGRLSITPGEAEYGEAILRSIEVPVAEAEVVLTALRDATSGRITVERP